MKVQGEMTNVVTKPDRFKKDGEKLDDGFLAVTMKFSIKQFKDADLGGLLLMLAKGKRVFVSIDAEQPELNFEGTGAVPADEDDDDEDDDDENRALPFPQQQVFSEPVNH